MKNYDETIDSVFSKIDKYNTLQKRKKKLITGCVATLSCICLAAISTILIWRNIKPAAYKQAADGILHTDSDKTIGDNSVIITQPENTDTPHSSNKIVINKLHSISSSKMDISLMCDDFVVMNNDELYDYYGINIFPSIPSDLFTLDDQQHGIFKREKGTGEIYHDVNEIYYKNDDYSRSVSVEVSKGKMPFSCVVISDKKAKPSIINGTEVKIASISDKTYYVEFMYNNVGFRIVTGGLNQNEMVGIVESIIE